MFMKKSLEIQSFIWTLNGSSCRNIKIEVDFYWKVFLLFHSAKWFILSCNLAISIEILLILFLIVLTALKALVKYSVLGSFIFKFLQDVKWTESLQRTPIRKKFSIEHAPIVILSTNKNSGIIAAYTYAYTFLVDTLP